MSEVVAAARLPYAPVGHATQLPPDVAELYDPAAHEVHTRDEVAAATLLNRPTAHEVQASDVDAAARLPYEPRAQDVQTRDVDAAARLP